MCKGLEADAMVLVDVPGLDANFRKEHLYVACSQARHLLTVVEIRHKHGTRGGYGVGSNLGCQRRGFCGKLLAARGV